MNRQQLLPILVIVALLGVFFLLQNQESSNTFDAYSEAFRINNPEENLAQIRIKDADGSFANLEKKEGYWQFNDYYVAREDAIELLFETLEKMRIRQPVPLAAKTVVLDNLKAKGKKIELFSTENPNEPSKSFLMYGIPHDKQGNYMMLEGSDEPFVVYIPGFEGELSIRMHTKIDKWRTHRVFGGSWKDIESVTVRYPENLENSFQIAQKEGNIKMIPLTSMRETPDAGKAEINVLKAQNILKRISEMNVESFDNGYSKRDSILQNKPFCVLDIKSSKSQLSQEMKIFEMPMSKRTKMVNMPDGKKQGRDYDRYFASMNNGKDFVTIQQFVFQDVLVKRDFLLIK